MSRIGKKPIVLPPGVSLDVKENIVSVQGPKGELSREIPREISLSVVGSEVRCAPRIETKKTPALWGLARSLVANMIEGVTSGFEKKLEFEGIGYRMAVEGSTLVMQVGFSHPVKIPAPKGISLVVEKSVITVSGINKELVGETAAYIRSIRPTEPYKGKGIRYQGEIIRRKAGKKAVASG
ncbi:MAG: 50S ribosomal protein L6 [Candidatus Sungbacteria bacterium GWC2_49_10]|uniref:Large ribosomal subunit protein uL6 n=2 Tax=Parcubacteria group TaxID=1794811 RepID=A0A0G1WRF6_9BACT|nr:MAG: 50S ribosomal protein L6 [Parcubacteria group bacterium GW2011_GWB1_50_9]KKW21120.1 MAG: 50S ribosomal protein L6 [Candidatus Adlerbacteria bacterium GW2011_GWC1_50_9]KKW33819.1 MAG: 50S ribosomal protein L6 [Parcubacteria group bacterium GW2011_GWA1_53_13]OGZ93383.1 MAG: 50S ribosomal protein L6 [Candidatus Sungbacteria bacterium GWC2_49_10]